MNVSTVGLDLAKNVFQGHAIDVSGDVIVRRSLRRRQVTPFFGKLDPCLVGMEACGTSHFWARELSALGHEVKLMPPIGVYRSSNVQCGWLPLPASQCAKVWFPSRTTSKRSHPP